MNMGLHASIDNNLEVAIRNVERVHTNRFEASSAETSGRSLRKLDIVWTPNFETQTSYCFAFVTSYVIFVAVNPFFEQQIYGLQTSYLINKHLSTKRWDRTKILTHHSLFWLSQFASASLVFVCTRLDIGDRETGSEPKIESEGRKTIDFTWSFRKGRGYLNEIHIL